MNVQCIMNIAIISELMNITIIIIIIICTMALTRV